MTKSLNQRFTYSNPPHFANPAITDWHIFDDGARIPINELVETANQQESHIADLLAEIQRLKQLVTITAPAAPTSGLILSPN